MSEIKLKTKHLSEVDIEADRNNMYFVNNELILFDNKYLHSRVLLGNGFEVLGEKEECRFGRASCQLKKKEVKDNKHSHKVKYEDSRKLELFKYDKKEKTLERIYKWENYLVFYGGFDEDDRVNPNLYFLNTKKLFKSAEKGKDCAFEKDLDLNENCCVIPKPRVGSILTYHKKTSTCIMYGGIYFGELEGEEEEENGEESGGDSGYVLKDIWILSLDNKKHAESYIWYQPTDIVGHIPFRANHSCISIGSNSYLIFGGVNEDDKAKSDVFIMETEFDMHFSDETKYKFKFYMSTPVIDASPMPLMDCSICYDKENENLSSLIHNLNVYIFGGKKLNKTTNKNLYEIEIEKVDLMSSLSYSSNVRNEYDVKMINHLRNLNLEFCIPLFIEKNITLEDMYTFTLQDFQKLNINEIVASRLLGNKIIKSFKGIRDEDETDAILTMIKENYSESAIQKAIDAIHDYNKPIDKDSLYTELNNNDAKSHPQKLRELEQELNGYNNKDDQEREIREAKKRDIEEMKRKTESDCLLCLEKHATHIYSNCGHLCVCEDCSKKYDSKCGVCNREGKPIEVKFPNPPRI